MHLNWHLIFYPSVHPLEIILRGTIVYLFLFFLLRFMRREAGSIGISDVLVVVLIADAAQNAMSSDYKSITDGVLLVSTIVFWDWSLDYIGYKFPAIQRLLRPPALLLIKDGRLQLRNLRHEMITREELQAQLREQGIENVSDVKKCYLEGDGKVSVIKKDTK